MRFTSLLEIITLLTEPHSSPNPTSFIDRCLHTELYSWAKLPCDYLVPPIPQEKNKSPGFRSGLWIEQDSLLKYYDYLMFFAYLIPPLNILLQYSLTVSYRHILIYNYSILCFIQTWKLLQKCTTRYRLRSHIMEFKPKGLKVLLSYIDLITLDWTVCIIHFYCVNNSPIRAHVGGQRKCEERKKRDVYQRNYSILLEPVG